MKSAFRREHTGAPGVDRMQRPAQQLGKKLGLCPFLEGRCISVKLVAGTAYTLVHGLGAPAAFFVIRQNYDGTGTQTRHPVESATSFQTELDQNNQLSIVCADSGTWDLWVYARASQPIPNGASQSP